MKPQSFWMGIVAMAFVALMCMMVGLAHGHENTIWTHDKRFVSYGQKHCGAGYILSKQANGSYQPYLVATHEDGTYHFHSTFWTIEAYDCTHMFEMLVMCSDPVTDGQITFCTGDPDPADPMEDEDAYTYGDIDYSN